jgi:hypothetical protein
MTRETSGAIGGGTLLQINIKQVDEGFVGAGPKDSNKGAASSLLLSDSI